jgi:hypothetical protein
MGDYLWMLALAAAWQQYADDEPPGPQMAHVDALVGQLKEPVRNAANDLAALLLVLVWFRWWVCAKRLAILITFRPGSLEFVANGPGGFHPVFPRGSRLVLGLPTFWPLSAPCQNDHLPIV